MPRVERLAESLSGPAPEGEAKEEERREILKRYLTPSRIDGISNSHDLQGNWMMSFKS
jgi:hypothetical protein